MKPCTCRIVSGGEFDESLVEQCDHCAELDAREKAEFDVEDDPNWAEKETAKPEPTLPYTFNETVAIRNRGSEFAYRATLDILDFQEKLWKDSPADAIRWTRKYLVDAAAAFSKENDR